MIVSSPNNLTGWIEVVVGPMFSGKSEELIRRLNRAAIARQPLMVFKPRIDDRYHPEDIVSHSKQSFGALPIDKARDILRHLAPDTRVVGIDEGQFFGPDLINVCEKLADSGVRVIVVGLDLDFKASPFSPMPELMAVAESVTKLSAVCSRCGAPANRSQRLNLPSNSTEQVQVGAKEAYEARCRFCFENPTHQQQGESP